MASYHNRWHRIAATENCPGTLLVLLNAPDERPRNGQSPGNSDSNFILRRNHTPPAASIQGKVALAFVDSVLQSVDLTMARCHGLKLRPRPPLTETQ
jgi:hypothetical protein